MNRDLAQVYEADGPKRLTPHLAIVNRPKVVNDTPASFDVLTVKIVELVSQETLEILVRIGS